MCGTLWPLAFCEASSATVLFATSTEYFLWNGDALTLTRFGADFASDEDFLARMTVRGGVIDRLGALEDLPPDHDRLYWRLDAEQHMLVWEVDGCQPGDVELLDPTHLVLDDFTTETALSTRTFPAPTLQHLLNPLTIDVDSSEATLLNNPDPYGCAALSDDEDNADEDETAPTLAPTAPRLAIKEYTNLAAHTVLAHLDPGSQKKATGSGSSAGSALPAGQKSKWMPQRTLWGNNNNGW
ncbi:hypothetical protein B0H10DRAFT_2230078 [Mycena sp. CBHHK59/15]|nr:hypothetical protein B0H10DRAFT_2230078 [Mycena sp. CBHHK59/15]